VSSARATLLWTNRDTFGTNRSQTRAHFPDPDIVINEGGGFSPTLELGGGVGT
jgi:hypothetical protein